MAESPTRRLSVPEVAQLFHVGEDKVRGWISAGELRAVNVATLQGKRPVFRINPVDVEAFEASRSMCARPSVRTVTQRHLSKVIEYF